MFETKRMHKLCKFKIYQGYTPRIATSMGKFIISSVDQHDFTQSCTNKSRTHITTKPGTTMLTINAGCSLNTTDIKLLNPSGIDAITNQKLNLEIEPIFRFQKSILVDSRNVIKQSDSEFREKLNKLEREHENDTPMNKHLEEHSIKYLASAVALIALIAIAVVTLYLKISIITPIITILRKHWQTKQNPPNTTTNL